MGEVKERLSIVDGFSQAFNAFKQGAKNASQSTDELNQAVTNLSQNSLDSIARNVEDIANAMRNAAEEQGDCTKETEKTAAATMNWMNMVKGVVASLGAVKLADTFIDSADAMSQMQAKLNVINDGLQTTDKLNQMIFSSAQRSRGSFEDTAGLVARLGMNAQEAFNSNAEAILFAENLNKAFKIAGASQQEQASVILQLSQALSGGILRGQEFNAVMSGAPNVIRTIAEYMQVPVGEMRDLAAEGKITADVVKAAMLNATESFNEQFEQLPMTWADMIQEGKNVIQYGLQEAFADWTSFINTDEFRTLVNMLTNAFLILARIGANALMAIARAIVWVRENINSLLPYIAAAGAAMLAYKASSIAAAVSSAAAWAISHWWLLAIIAVVLQVSSIIGDVGITFEELGKYIGTVFGGIYTAIYNVFADIWNIVAEFVEFFANVWSDPIASIVRMFVGLFETILGVVKRVAKVIDTLLGTSWGDAVEEFQDNIQNWVDSKYGKAQITVERMDYKDLNETATAWGNKGAEIAKGLETGFEDLTSGFSALDEINSQLTGLDELVNAVGDTGEIANVGTVSEIKGDVNLADEDIKVLRDLAEMKYMQKIELKTLAPNVYVSVPETAAGTLSAEDVADTVQKVLIEQMSSHTATAH